MSEITNQAKKVFLSLLMNNFKNSSNNHKLMYHIPDCTDIDKCLFSISEDKNTVCIYIDPGHEFRSPTPFSTYPVTGDQNDITVEWHTDVLYILNIGDRKKFLEHGLVDLKVIPIKNRYRKIKALTVSSSGDNLAVYFENTQGYNQIVILSKSGIDEYDIEDRIIIEPNTICKHECSLLFSHDSKHLYVGDPVGGKFNKNAEFGHFHIFELNLDNRFVYSTTLLRNADDIFKGLELISGLKYGVDEENMEDIFTKDIYGDMSLVYSRICK